MHIDLIDAHKPADVSPRRAAPALIVILVGIAMLAVGAAVALGADATVPPVQASTPSVQTTVTAPAHAHVSVEEVDLSGPEEPEGRQLRLTSPDGRFRAYADPLAPGESLYEPGARTETTIEVRDQLMDITTTHTFSRNLEPEAFSPDGLQLYVIDHRPAGNPSSYRVSGINLRNGDLYEVLGPNKTQLPDEMRGSGRQQVWSPDGTQLYTLYVRQYHDHEQSDSGDGLHADGQPEAAFVHVLDVESGWAICLDLPAGFGLGPPDSTAILLTGDDTITVVDHAIGMRINIQRLSGPGQFDIGEPRAISHP